MLSRDDGLLLEEGRDLAVLACFAGREALFRRRVRGLAFGQFEIGAAADLPDALFDVAQVQGAKVGAVALDVGDGLIFPLGGEDEDLEVGDVVKQVHGELAEEAHDLIERQVFRPLVVVALR